MELKEKICNYEEIHKVNMSYAILKQICNDLGEMNDHVSEEFDEYDKSVIDEVSSIRKKLKQDLDYMIGIYL